MVLARAILSTPRTKLPDAAGKVAVDLQHVEHRLHVLQHAGIEGVRVARATTRAKHHLGRAQCSFLRTANFFGIWLDSLESPIRLPAFERRVVTLLHQGIKGTVIVVDTEPIKNRF